MQKREGVYADAGLRTVILGGELTGMLSHEAVISEKVGFELRGYKVIPRIKIIYSIIDNTVYIEYIKNTWLSEKTMLERMGYCWE